MLGPMNVQFGPNGQSKGGPNRLARRAIGAGLLVLLFPILGACAPLTTLPAPPGPGSPSPAIPGPFDNYDPARPPAYKPAPPPRPPAREKREEPPSFGGVLRPAPEGPPEGRDKREREDD